MGKFFESWALWQKLTFVLGCAIIVTILLGGAKLFYTHRKLRKHITIAEREKTMLATLQRHMSQRRRRANSRENDVPFGIRAIESGIEVEGVWISRTNSEVSLPIHSRDTTGSSSTWDQVPRKDFESDIEKQVTKENQPRTSTTSNSSAGIAASPRYYSARNSSSDHLPSSRNSRDESPDMANTRASRNRHPPLSYSRYSGNPALIRTGSAASTLSALEAIHRASGPIDPSTAESSFGSNSSNGPSDSAPISASAPNLLTHQPRPRKPSTDLDLMHTHRMSQAAETGQLTPRVRKPSHGSSDWNNGAADNNNNNNNNSAVSTPRSATFPDLTDYFTTPSHRRRSRSPSPGASSPSPTKSDHHVLQSSIVRTSSLPDVTPFTKFCQTGPGSPLASSPSHSRSSSTSTSTERSPTMESHVRTLSAPTTTQTLITSTTPPSTTHLPSTHPSTTPKQEAAPIPSTTHSSTSILRGHGTGFEILRPGTLRTPLPPVSLQNSHHHPSSFTGSGSEAGSDAGRSSSGEEAGRRGRRKLVKKRGRVSRSRAGSEGGDGKGVEVNGVKVKGNY